MESKSKQICLLEHTHENACKRTPAASTRMHARTATHQDRMNISLAYVNMTRVRVSPFAVGSSLHQSAHQAHQELVSATPTNTTVAARDKYSGREYLSQDNQENLVTVKVGLYNSNLNQCRSVHSVLFHITPGVCDL